MSKFKNGDTAWIKVVFEESSNDKSAKQVK